MKIFFFLAYIENLHLKDDFLKISSFVCEVQSTPSYNPFSQMNIWEHSKKEAGIWPVVFVSCSQCWAGAGWGEGAQCLIALLLLRKAIFILPIDYRMARSRSLKAPTIVEEEKAEQFKESND